MSELDDARSERPPSRRLRYRGVAWATALVVAAAAVGFGGWRLAHRHEVLPVTLRPNGAIAFLNLRRGSYGGDLYSVQPDGGGLRRLTHSAGMGVDFAFSPDGSEVAFGVGAQDFQYRDVKVMNSDGTGIRQLTHEAVLTTAQPGTLSYDQFFSWLPDGSAVRYVHNPGHAAPGHAPGYGVWEVNADGTNARIVLSGFAPWEPAWSPDGSHIAWIGGFGDRGVFVANTDSTDHRELTDDPGRDSFPTWSPDGNEIAFVDAGKIQVIGADGTGRLTMCSSCGGVQWGPAWSPDGTKIAFVVTVGGRGQLEIMNSDGTGAHRVPVPLDVCCPVWLPAPS